MALAGHAERASGGGSANAGGAEKSSVSSRFEALASL